jgi:hypothetical protein
LLVLCLDFSSYYWFLQESQKIGRQQAASPCDARSEQQVCCLLADQRGSKAVAATLWILRRGETKGKRAEARKGWWRWNRAGPRRSWGGQFRATARR